MYEYYQKLIKFLEKYHSLIDCHLIDFLTHNLWDQYLPQELKYYFNSNNFDFIKEDIFSEVQTKDSPLNKFLSEIKLITLHLKEYPKTEDNYFDEFEREGKFLEMQPKYLTIKKEYEIQIFCKLINNLVKNRKCVIIDAGAGKAYFSIYYSSHFELPIIAIESSLVKYNAALLYFKQVKKAENINPMVHYRLEYINKDTDFSHIISEEYPILNDTNIFITSLHACGSLSDSIIEAFIRNDDIKNLCIVPCCYHLSEKTMTNIYEFSKNVRNLAQQSNERMKMNKKLSPSLFYRAVLQVYLKSIGIDKHKIGRHAPINNFVEYAKWALRKIENMKIPLDEELQEFYDQFTEHQWKFEIFQFLRIQMAPLIELAIILDKVLYLQNSNQNLNVKLLRIFDPEKSPRSWAIIAQK